MDKNISIYLVNHGSDGEIIGNRKVCVALEVTFEQAALILDHTSSKWAGHTKKAITNYYNDKDVSGFTLDGSVIEIMPFDVLVVFTAKEEI